jgi:hypothetical protein
MQSCSDISIVLLSGRDARNCCVLRIRRAWGTTLVITVLTSLIQLEEFADNTYRIVYMSTHTLIVCHYPVAINRTDRAHHTAKRNRVNSQ